MTFQSARCSCAHCLCSSMLHDAAGAYAWRRCSCEGRSIVLAMLACAGQRESAEMLPLLLDDDEDNGGDSSMISSELAMSGD